MSNTLSVDTWTTTPAILAVVRADGSLVAAGNAPQANEYITIYAIGLGAVTPDVPLGGDTSASALATTIITPQLSLGSSSITVAFSGLAPGFVGLYQVNAQMPSVLPQGASGQLTLTDDGQVTSTQIALQ
jgi:uncharacterized protein (TIGR03437 family)